MAQLTKRPKYLVWGVDKKGFAGADLAYNKKQALKIKSKFIKKNMLKRAYIRKYI